MLDNAPSDGSAEAVREFHPEARLIALERRAGKAENDTRLLQESRGRLCLLLNEDSEPQTGAAQELVNRSTATRAPRPPEPVAGWPRPAWGPAPGGCRTCPGHSPPPCSSTAHGRAEHGHARARGGLGAVERDARAARGGRAGGLARPRLLRLLGRDRLRRRLHDSGWKILFVPGARAVHHDQLTTDEAAMQRRIVEFHRNRDLYFVKHGCRSRASFGGSAGPGPIWRAPGSPRSCPVTTPTAIWRTRAAARAGPRGGDPRGGRRDHNARLA